MIKRILLENHPIQGIISAVRGTLQLIILDVPLAIGPTLKNVTKPNLNNWFREHYGSRRGFVLTWWSRLQYQLGGYRSYQQIDWQSVERLVFVCKGNICRSAYAEAVARSLGAESASCGIDTRNGLPADDDAIRMAEKKGVILMEHKTTPIESMSFKNGDLLIGMEAWQVEYLERNLDRENRCTLLGLWGNPKKPHIHDPYGASNVYFEECFNYIEKSVHEIARKIR